MEKSTTSFDLKGAITFVFYRLRCLNIIFQFFTKRNISLCRNTASRSLCDSSGTMSGSNSPTSSNRSSKGARQVYLGNQCRLLPVTTACKCVGRVGPHTAKTVCRKFETNISRNQTARLQSQFLRSWFCERFIYTHDRSADSAAENRWTYRGNI